MSDNLYNTLNQYFRETFQEKIYKVSIDGGFTCPNRDGKVALGGCIFCGEKGSGEFTYGNLSILEQIDKQLELIKKKFPSGKVIAYFQNFTNTYGPIDYLEKIYREALSHPRVMGIAIATRPDCIDENIIDLLDKINKEVFVWIELGLQTINDKVGEKINRGYQTKEFVKAAKLLREKKIKFVTHIIIGLPGEEMEDPLETAKFSVENGTWGLKIHSMYIDSNTKLEELYNKKVYLPIEKNYYINKIVKIIGNIPNKIVLHRITGDPDKKTLVAPWWMTNKKDVLNSINKKLKEEKIYQGKFL